MECSKNARLLFLGMWNFCDDKGRHSFSPKQLKAQVFPGDNDTEEDILGMLLELYENGLIMTYTVEDREYLCITGWHHQRIDKPQASRLPEALSDDSGNVLGTFLPGKKERKNTELKERTKERSLVLKSGNGQKAPRTSTKTTAMFEHFWSLYPRGEKKKQAMDIWKRKQLEDESDPIFEDVWWRKQNDPDWLKGFVPHATTYLNGERWKDDRKEVGDDFLDDPSIGAIDAESEVVNTQPDVEF